MGLLDRDPADKSYMITLTVRKGRYKLKLTRKRKSNNLYSERLTLLDWISNENLDLRSNDEITNELMAILWHHIHEEGVFARNLRTEYERRRIKDRLNGLPHAIRRSTKQK